jgi:hypothetical protein
MIAKVRHDWAMQFFKSERISASITPDGLVITHANGAHVKVSLRRLEGWLLRMLRSDI